MGKGRKRPQKRGMKGHRPKIPEPSTSAGETAKGASKNIADGRITVKIFRFSEEREVTETSRDRQDKNPKKQKCLSDQTKDAHESTSVTGSENKKKEVKQNPVMQEVRGRRKRGWERT